MKQNILTIILTTILSFSITQTIHAADPSLQFSPSTIITNQNDEFQAKIRIDTAGNDTGGVGAKLEYDASFIQIINIDTQQSDTFADYPTKSYDNTAGRATISGVVSSSNNLYNGSGTVATITFKSIKQGNTTVKFQFIPGSTTDSNIAVTFGNGDILSKVTNLDITINQATSQNGTTIPTATTQPSNVSRPTSVPLDPYGPIPSQAPNTDPSTNQPQTSESIDSKPDIQPNSQTQSTNNNMLYIIIATVASAVIVLIWLFIFKRKIPTPPQGPSQPQMPDVTNTTHQVKIPPTPSSEFEDTPPNNPSSNPPQSTY